MKIKYIANFTDGTEWSKSATYNALNFDALGHDVYCVDFKYNQNNVVKENRIIDLLNKQSDTFDYCFQQVLPPNYRYYGNTRNVGVLGLDTRTITSTPWIKGVRMMDKMLVPDRYTKMALDSINVKSSIFNYSFNLEDTLLTPKVTDLNSFENTFNFLIVGEIGKVKNLEAAIIAFHSEFAKFEPVNLIIGSDKDPQITNDYVLNIVKQAKLGINGKKEVIFPLMADTNLTTNFLKISNAFICPDYGTSWDNYALQAMAFGSPVIYTDGLGVEEFASPQFKIPSRIIPCYGVANDSYLFSSNDYWNDISIIDLKASMRSIFELWRNSKAEYISLREQNAAQAAKFDYRTNNLNRSFI
jgi:glycosyltransferase involved in cell wall biosynthesis